jgi:hypothetical protein
MKTIDVSYHGSQALFNVQSDLSIYKTYHHSAPQLYIIHKMLMSYPLGFSGPETEIILWENNNPSTTEQKLIKICTD